MAYDAAFGTPAVVVDPNSLYARWAYDGFGRLAEETRPGGKKTTYARKAGSKAAGFVVALETKVDGGADDVTEYDKLGRAIRWTTQPPRPLARCAQAPCPGASVPRVAQEVEFDELGGRVARRSLPHPDGMPVWQRRYDDYTYDAVGRVVTHTSPWGATTSYSYDGLDVITHAPLAGFTIVQQDRLGRPLVVTDAEQGTTSYS